VADRQKTPGRYIVISAILDLALVLIFVLIGRRSHGESLSASGIVQTFWPFLIGLLLGWLVTLAWREPTRIRWPGIPVWLVTVAAGMAFRAASMQGVQLSFVIVTTVVLGVFLLGWRALAIPITRATARRRAA
jgi:hypothetical protein